MTITEQLPLSNFTTFKIGGKASFFVAVSSVDELKEALHFAVEKNLPIFILGGGSNILISDEGFAGLVIKMEIMGIKKGEIDEKTGKQEIIAGAGEGWDHFVAHTISENLVGLENLSYIPGTVGAAPIQNIGAYGAEAKDTISWVEVIDASTHELELKKLTNEQCQFGYRDSIFKKPEGKKYIVTRVAFSLTPYIMMAPLNTSYKDITQYIQENNISEVELSLKRVRDIVIEIRKKKLPDVFLPNALGTAGSFFKNPVIRKEAYEDLLKKYPDLPNFPTSDKDYVKVSAAWMIDKICGFKGFREGDVGVYQNQALVLVNFGKATAEQVIAVSGKMFWDVKQKTGIELEREVQII